jgi:arsenate reductase (thioredoxin)
MAEGVLRTQAGNIVRVESAVSAPAGHVHRLATEVMSEIGIDISGYRSKHFNEFLNEPVHTVITVCGYADAACPTFPGTVYRYHWNFVDPASAEGSEADLLVAFQMVRNEIIEVFGAYAAGLRTAKDYV